MPSVLFVFLDGVGLGDDQAAYNPLVAAATPHLQALLGSALHQHYAHVCEDTLLIRALDACLGVAGLPQSATGQSSLLTGHNAAAVMQRHYGPYPGPTLQKLLRQGTLFSDLEAHNKRCCLANAYATAYVQALQDAKQKSNVPVYAARHAGLLLRTEAEYRQGLAIAADLQGAYFHKQDSRVPVRTPAENGAMLADLARDYSLCFFDFWLSDLAGHRWDFAEACALVAKLDSFLGAVLAQRAPDTTVLITSDHGNLEDKRSKSHSYNAVPLIVVGEAAPYFQACQSIADIAEPLQRYLLAT